MRKTGWLLAAATLALMILLTLRGTTSAEVFAQAINNPPVLQTIAPIYLALNGSTTFSAVATDPDIPGQTLTFTLTNLTPLYVVTADMPPNSATIDVSAASPPAPVAVPAGTYQFTVTVTDNGTPPLSDTQIVTVFVDLPTNTPTVTPTTTITLTPTATGTVTPTPTPTATVTLLPTVSIPTATPTFTPTFIPPLASRTPLPRPANAGLAVPLNPARVRFVVNRDGVNVRILPAIGAPLAGIVNSGFTDLAEAISGDGEWLRFSFEGNDAWVGFPVISVIEGDIGSLPVEDPRTIPYGGFENPRAGLTSVTSANQGRLEFSGLRVRGGPGLGYPVLANAPRYAVFSLLGRNEEGSWIQVNYEGTLGWMASQYVQYLTAGGITPLPIGGIVADALPFSERTFDSYTDTLRLLLSRIEIAIASLEGIRARWTSVALEGNLQCGGYPFRPTDYNIPNPVLAAFYGTLDPLQTDFNQAMGSLRRAIDLLVDVCEGRRVPAETVNEALDLINQVDGLFASLRARLIALIPPDLAFDPATACLFTFNSRSEVIDRLVVNQVRSITLTPDDRVDGFCFDGEAGRSYKLEVLAYTGNPQPRVSVSPFDNPTNFISVGSASAERTLISIAPILIPATGRYLVIVSDLQDRQAPIQGDIAVLLTDVTGLSGVGAANLSIDANGNLVVNPFPNQGSGLISTPIPGFPTSTVPAGGGGISPANCPNVTYTCAQIQAVGGSCDTARSCLLAGNQSLDPDGDGTPCENVLCPGN